MIWLVWRRQRLALLFALGLVALVAAAAAVGRYVALDIGRDLGVLPCLRGALTGPCQSNVWYEYLDGLAGAVFWLQTLLVVLPVLAGAAAGAGLFGREMERGTHVFALSQHTSRLRWWATGMLVAGAPVALAVGLLTVVAALAVRPFGNLYTNSPLSPNLFITTGALPAVYTMLAFGVAAAAGLVLRNALVAVVVTGIVQILVVVVLSLAARDSYLPPVAARTPLPANDNQSMMAVLPADAWQVYARFLDGQGREIRQEDAYSGTCDAIFYVDCLRADGIVGSVTYYHPASRYWPFQAIESGILLALVAGTLGVGLWGLRRRVH